jgi:hypothetical protein
MREEHMTLGNMRANGVRTLAEGRPKSGALFAILTFYRGDQANAHNKGET